MSKALTFAQKILLTTPNIKLLAVLSSGEKTFLELRTEGVSSVDNTLYFLDIVTKTPDGNFKLTTEGQVVADALGNFLKSVNSILPGE